MNDADNNMVTPKCPWFNRPQHQNQTDNDEDRQRFADVLQSGSLRGRRIDKDNADNKNLYLCIGFASQGYADWPSVEQALSAWCDANDERHREAGTGWILLTNGDGNYNRKSIESIAQFVSARGTPVVFVQSDFAYCEPDDTYWPTYASAGFFGKGVFHDLDKVDEAGWPLRDADGAPQKRECWGGFAKDSAGAWNGRISYPDAAVLHEEFDNLTLGAHLGGIFVAGGGDIACEQVELYGWDGSRDGDCFVPASAADGTPSKLNATLSP